MNEKYYRSHLSVDCALFGFDGSRLKVLLIERSIKEEDNQLNDMKLPGSLIYRNEDPDIAAGRVLHELTGLKNTYLKQFKCFGSLERTSNPRDMFWIMQMADTSIERIITIGYTALVRIDRHINNISPEYKARWWDVAELPQLAFDHNKIIEGALAEIRVMTRLLPSIVFELLPKKFTATELRNLYGAIENKSIDVRNFHKKLSIMHWVVPLDETQKNVPHRAARYYKFDKKIYNKHFNS